MSGIPPSVRESRRLSGGGPANPPQSWSAARRDPGRDECPVPIFRAIACSGCGQLLHAPCIEEATTSIWGYHLWFSNMPFRAFVDEHYLIRLKVAFCKGCHEELCGQILGNYKALERFDEGARLLEDIGNFEEAGEFLAAIRG